MLSQEVHQLRRLLIGFDNCELFNNEEKNVKHSDKHVLTLPYSRKPTRNNVIGMSCAAALSSYKRKIGELHLEYAHGLSLKS